jgi:hypothetical protein
MSERHSVNKVVFTFDVCISRSLCETVVLVHGHEQDRVVSVTDINISY